MNKNCECVDCNVSCGDCPACDFEKNVRAPTLQEKAEMLGELYVGLIWIKETASAAWVGHEKYVAECQLRDQKEKFVSSYEDDDLVF